MPYMDEWEYRLWFQLHRNELPELLAVEQTSSEEVGEDGAQHALSGDPKFGLKEN